MGKDRSWNGLAEVANGCLPGSTLPLRRVVSAWRHGQYRHRGFDRFGTESSVLQAFDALCPRFGCGFRNSVLDADHVVGVGIVAHKFDRVAGEGWRVAALPRLAGKESGPFAIEPLGPGAASLEQQLLHVRVVVEIEDDSVLGVFVHARFGEYSV